MMFTTAPPFGCRPPEVPSAFLQHPLADAFAREQEAAGQVVAHDGIPALGADRRQRRVELAARVVDERVDAAVAREHGRNRRLHLRLFADVALMGRAGAAGVLDLALDRGELVGLAADDGHRGAERRQLVRSAAADPRAAAGDQRHLPSHQAGREDRSIGGHDKAADRPDEHQPSSCLVSCGAVCPAG
jgi:hypothetical protein